MDLFFLWINLPKTRDRADFFCFFGARLVPLFFLIFLFLWAVEELTLRLAVVELEETGFVEDFFSKAVDVDVVVPFDAAVVPFEEAVSLLLSTIDMEVPFCSRALALALSINCFRRSNMDMGFSGSGEVGGEDTAGFFDKSSTLSEAAAGVRDSSFSTAADSALSLLLRFALAILFAR